MCLGIKRFFPVLVLLVGLLSVSESIHANKLVMAITAYEPKAVILEKWKPIIAELNQHLNPIELELRPLTLEEMDQAVMLSEVDFVFTNPAHYIKLSHRFGLTSPLVSLIREYDGQPIRGFGGVIIVRNDRTDILELQDLRHRTIAIPGKQALGAYIMQAFELKQHNLLDQVRFIETKMPLDNVVKAVLQQQADAGFIRTGLLESLAHRSDIDLTKLRIINPQKFSSFPLAISTRIYPEWTFAATHHVDSAAAGKVAGALLALPYQAVFMKLADVYGFSIAADHEPIREVMMALRVEPYHIEPELQWADIWLTYQHEIAILTLGSVIITLLAIGLLVSNRRLTRSLVQIKQNDEKLRLSAVAFETREAILITDSEEKIIQVNKAFSEITGYSAEDAIGQTPRLLKSGLHDKSFYQSMWDEIIQYGGWRGELWNRRKNGELYPEHQVITAIKNKQGLVTHYLSSFSDITLRKLNEERIHNLAFFDPLTGLANRRLLEDHIEQALASSSRHLHYCALLFIDLDHFKNINDTLGHKLGDELLVQVAQRLKDCVREGDTVARPGGDEFIVLLQGLGIKKTEAANQTQIIAEKLLASCNEPYQLPNHQYIVTASIGINLFVDHQETSEELMKRSDLAMYQAKAEGRNAIRFFDPAMQEAAAKRSQLESDLRLALEKNEFLLYYQPKVNLQGELQGYEALIRWQHPTKGMISPANFIPVAEETGLIVQIGHWVLRQACKTLQKFQTQPEKQHLTLAVNLSARQFRKAEFVSELTNIIQQYNIDPTKFELELTESMLMDNIEDTIEKMHTLKTIGVHFALDDFGTGYSSLSYLKNLPLGFLKIDQSFVNDMLHDPNDAAIVETIIALAKTLKLRVIAEGVETQHQSDALSLLGCDMLQGYLYGKPQPLDI